MKYLIITLFVFLCLPLLAAERLDMEGTRIRGNQELPKVLYIVPWQSAEIPNLDQPPLESIIDEALTPLDREVFQRTVNYYDSLSSQKLGDNVK